MEKVHDPAYAKMHRSAWTRTGCAMTADGSGDGNIRPQGHDSYAPPTPPGGRAADPDGLEDLFEDLFGPEEAAVVAEPPAEEFA